MATPSVTAHVAIPDHVMTRVVAGSTILLDVRSGRSFTLDAVGTQVWTCLQETGTIAGTLDALARQFDADPAQLERDVLDLVGRLAAGSLLDITD